MDRVSRTRNALPREILCHVPRSTERYPDRNCVVTPIGNIKCSLVYPIGILLICITTPIFAKIIYSQGNFVI